MARPEIEPSAEAKRKHFDAMQRLHEEFGTSTQVELANALGVRQSSISDAKVRCAYPDGWLITAMRATNVNPDWIVTGKGPRYRLPADEAGTPCDPAAIEAKLRREVGELSTDELLQELVKRVPGLKIVMGE